jgi:hypothetical protein
VLLTEFLRQEHLVFLSVRSIAVFGSKVFRRNVPTQLLAAIFYLHRFFVNNFIHLFRRVLRAAGAQSFELDVTLAVHVDGNVRCFIVTLSAHSDGLCFHLQHLDLTLRAIWIFNRIYLQRRSKFLGHSVDVKRILRLWIIEMVFPANTYLGLINLCHSHLVLITAQVAQT